MKKISLKSIKTEELLSREELKQIIGGTNGSEDESGWSTFKCKCYNSSIIWEARYKSVETMVEYIQGTCPNGGTCTAS